MAVTDPTPTSPANNPSRLGCGRNIDDLWDTVDQPSNAHEQTCPDCQAARASLTDLATATQQLAEADRADPTLRTSPDVLGHILSIARAEVRRGRRIPLEQRAAGPALVELTVSEQTIAAVIRRTSDDIDGLEARRCRVTLSEPEPPSDAGPMGAPAEITVDLRVSVAATAPIPDVTRRLRTEVRDAIEQQVGILTTTINITVEDVHDE